MHPALLRIVHILAECEAERLCAPVVEKQVSAKADKPEPEKLHEAREGERAASI